MMGKEAKGFNIDKENYTWSKEIKEELTLVWGQATKCEQSKPAQKTRKLS